MMEINNIVRLSDGRSGKIIATPSGFLSNGAYEIEIRESGERKWVKDDQILYVIDTEFVDDISNYFEVIYDKNGVHLIPKMLEEITIFDENEELKSIEFKMAGGNKHDTITFHIGDTSVWSSDKPKPEEEEKTETKKHRIL